MNCKDEFPEDKFRPKTNFQPEDEFPEDEPRPEDELPPKTNCEDHLEGRGRL